MNHHGLLILKTLSTATLSTIVCLSLIGCSTTSETFDCKAGKGIGCKSISEVNQIVDQGALGAEKDMQLDSLPASTPIVATHTPTVEVVSHQPEILLSEHMAVHRAQEEHLRVWIAPFQDEHGNLHEGNVIHTVLKPGYWQLKAPTQNTNDQTNTDLEEVN